MNNKIYKSLTRFALRLHNFSYKLSGLFAIKIEDGLHPKHRLMKYHRFFVNNVEPNDIVLDIGCGNGALTLDLAKKVKKVIGIDLNKDNIRIARKNYSASNIEYLVGDVTKCLAEGKFEEKFDVIILSNVLEHVKKRVELLKKIKNLTPKILIRVPMVNRDWITLYKKELGIEWRSDKTHYIEYTLNSFQEELQKADLKIEKYSIQFGEIWAGLK